MDIGDEIQADYREQTRAACGGALLIRCVFFTHPAYLIPFSGNLVG